MTDDTNGWCGRNVLIYAALTAAMALIAWVYSTVYQETQTLRDLIIIGSFVGLGMLIKYGDEAFDVDQFSKRASMILAVPGGLWMGLLMVYDTGSAIIFSGLLLALLLARKYDNAAFKMGFAIAGSLSVLAFILTPSSISIISIAVVFATALADEFGNDRADRNGRGLAAGFLRERPFLKIAVLLLCAFGLLPSLLYFFAFMGFDFAYSLVERFGMLRRLDAVPA